MANGEFIEILSPSALKDLQTANAEIVTMISNVDKVGAKMKGIATPSGSDSAIKSLTAEYQKQEKVIQNTQKALEKARLEEIKLQQAREKAFVKYDAQLSKEQAKLTQANSLYNQTQQKVNQLSKAYNDLAIKKELGGNLTTKELTQLSKLTNQINIYQSALKKVDADIQKNQRNVGNYASGWNGLGNSINQLSREMPAFANSAQTGFMAISNNLPILFDEITKIKQANKELLAQGKPIQSLGSQIAGAFFSWGTALSVGVTLLTVFAPKIWEMVAGSKASKKAIEAEKKAREEQIEIEKQHADAQTRYASDEQARAKISLENAKNTSLPLKERLKYVEELRNRYPDYLGLLSKEEILAGKTADAEFRLNEALMKRALFLAVQDKIKETTKELVDAEFKYLSVAQKTYDLDNQYDKNLDKKTGKRQKLRLVTEQEASSLEYLNQAEKDYQNSISKGSIKQQTASDVLRKNTIIAKEKLNILYRILNQNAKYNSVVNEEKKAIEKSTKAKRDDVKSVVAQGLKSQEYLQVLEEQLRLYKEVQSEVSSTSKEYKAFQNVIDGLQQSIDLIKDPSKVLTADVSGLERQNEMYLKNLEALKKLKEATDAWLNSFTQDFWNNSSLPSLQIFFDGTFDKLLAGAETAEEKFAVTFNAIAESAQEAFNLITEASNASFKNEYANLEKQKNISLAFAGENEEARAEVERQAEERRKQIARREFQAKKKQAKANIAIDMAQALIALWVKPGFPAAIPMAAVVAGLGIAQMAMVDAQQMPEFWKGTDNAPEGWALTQEKGRELILDKNNNLKSKGSDKGATKTWLNKGDKVIPHEKTMEYLMFNNELNGMLTNNQISEKQPIVNVNSGMSDAQVDRIVSSIKNKSELHIIKDKFGERSYERKQRQTVEIANARVNFKSSAV